MIAGNRRDHTGLRGRDPAVAFRQRRGLDGGAGCAHPRAVAAGQCPSNTRPWAKCPAEFIGVGSW